MAADIDYSHVITALRIALAEIDHIQDLTAKQGSPDPTTETLSELVAEILTHERDDRAELFSALCVLFDALELMEERMPNRLRTVSN
jgi:hypothetical protein